MPAVGKNHLEPANPPTRPAGADLKQPTEERMGCVDDPDPRWQPFQYWGIISCSAMPWWRPLDRLLHHSHVITIRGDSYRVREKRRTGLLKAPAIAPSNASTGMTMSLPRWANRQPPTRAASSLVRALRYARGTLLFATWTSRCDRASGQHHFNPGVQFFMSERVQFRRSVDKW